MRPLALLPHLKALRDWRKRGWSDQAPQFVKQAVLRKYAIPDATWVETGTYRGTTTRFLATLAERVHTIEPAPRLYKRAARRFRGTNVEVINGTSEAVFPELLPKLSGDVCFWLDGHYSAGQTFKGNKDCPVEDELAAIAANLPRFGRISILIDDVRCFLGEDPAYADYPSLDDLVDWARTQGMAWRIEQDIFIIRNRPAA